MKVAIACFNLKWLAGGPRMVFSLAQAMKAMGHEVTVYAPDFDPAIYPHLSAGITVRRVEQPEAPSWIAAGTGLALNVRRKLREERALLDLARRTATALDPDTDVLNCHDYAYLVPRFLPRGTKRPRTVWTLNEPPYMYLPKPGLLYDLASRCYNRWKDIVARKYFLAIDRVVVVNEANKRWASLRGLDARIVRPGVDFNAFASPVKARKAGDRRVKLLSVGAPNKYRRFEDTIRAAALLKKRGWDVRADIVGKNIWGQDEYCASLKNLAREQGIGDAVRFHFEGVSEEEIRTFYRTSDLFVLPIHLPPPRNGYGWQLSGFEAMSAGVPVIISRANDSTEVLRDGVDALFVDPESPEQIADRAETLLKDPGRYHAVAAAGQKVAQGLSWESYARRLLALAGTAS